MGYKAKADLVKALKGKVVYIAGINPMGNDLNLEKALKEAKAVIAQELFLNETAKLADVVLPAQAFTERDGSYTSGERRVQRFYPAVTLPAGTKADFSITALVAAEIGIDQEGSSARKVMDRLSAVVPAFAGISYAAERLRRELSRTAST